MARRRQTTPTPPDLRERILADFATLKVPLTAEQFDAVLAAAQREGLSVTRKRPSRRSASAAGN